MTTNINAAIQEAVRGHINRNEALLARLFELGVNLQRKRPIDLHFFAPTSDVAKALAQALRLAGYLNVAIGEPQDDSGIVSVEAAVVEAPSIVATPARVKRLVTIAARVGATHDGWGTSVEPKP